MRLGRAQTSPLVAVLVGVVIACASGVGAFASAEAAQTAVSPSPAPPARSLPASVVVAVDGLKSSPPLYNSPNAPLALTGVEVGEVEQSIATAGTPIFIAILPRAGMRPDGVAEEMYNAMKVPGTYVAIVGTVYDTFSTLVDVKSIMTRAFAAERANGTAAVLVLFSDLVGQTAHGTQKLPAGFPWAVFLIVVAAALIVSVAYVVYRALKRPGSGTAADVPGPPASSPGPDTLGPGTPGSGPQSSHSLGSG